MSIIEKNEERENRIEDEVIVDAYCAEERVTGWYYYLQDKISFPFEASCIKTIRKSPLKEGEKVTVLEMGSEEDIHMYANIQWKDCSIEVPLEQLYPLNACKGTVEAVEDWHYWVGRGYQF